MVPICTRSWIPVAFGIIYLPLTATPYKHISNAVMSLVCMQVIFIVSLICCSTNYFWKKENPPRCWRI